MRQLTCTAPGTVEWQEVPEPRLQDDAEALLRPLAALLPEVMPLIVQGRLRPQEVTTRVVDWEEAPAAYLEPDIKLVVRRS